MMRKVILITDEAGFLGTHLCVQLLNDGHEVICVDNCFTGSKENIYHLVDNSCFDFLRHDTTFPLYVEMDQICKLSCPASPIHYQFDPVQITKSSVFLAIQTSFYSGSGLTGVRNDRIKLPAEITTIAEVDPRQRKPNKIMAKISWREPKVKLEEVLMKTNVFFDGYLGVRNA